MTPKIKRKYTLSEQLNRHMEDSDWPMVDLVLSSVGESLLLEVWETLTDFTRVLAPTCGRVLPYVGDLPQRRGGVLLPNRFNGKNYNYHILCHEVEKRR